MIHFQQAISSVIPGETLQIVDFSDDILPIQADFENEEGNANTCTECDFVKKPQLVNQIIYCYLEKSRSCG
jgi:hypothetical protein